ncbi:D-alanyl-D-alanine carboxypeptidase family protein [Amycolatopsis nigrescens]|uniref:D-alanyl-D-alanine carboxypeptidase family protein n=1 Tax=Amycolatopsis nigrescens TaxID=381445 RepID=UPI00037521D7|nr:D-alanyl-D-alanine carboxypeptidase family protein [Amycolatopsis nigrescens]
MLSGLLALTAAPVAVAAPPVTTPPTQPSPCAYRELPPPPVDTSERPAPGQQEPRPLPVPDKPLGGDRMSDCGVVLPPKALNPPENNAHSWVIQDLDSGDVLAAKDPHARQRPASLIKTLLALVVVKELKPDQVVTVTAEDASQECTCVGIVAGGRYTVDQLLHGLLMHSGNDVAHAFATALGGVPAAVQKMNKLAAAIGANDTRAATPSGLDGPGMSTSAYDLSLIFNQAMKQPEFAKAVGTRQFEFPGFGDKPAFPIYNDNKLLSQYPGFLGGKTGFTDDARHTYVGGAAQNGRKLAVVMLRAEQQPARVSDQAAKLLDYGFALAKAGTKPVGQIVRVPVPEPALAGAGPDLNSGDNANTGTGAGADDPFGTTGWILTLVVALIIGAGFVIGHRRKQAAERS